MKKIILLLAIGLMGTTSCSKFLDVKPVGKLIPTEIEEFDNILNSVNTIDFHLADNNRGSALTGLSDMIYMTDNVIKYYYNPSSVNLPRMASYVFAAPYLDFNKPDYYFDWGCYKAVGLFNNIIDGIETLGASEDSYGKEVVAQARAGRGWSLLITGISYGLGYNPNGSNDSKTIPYRMTGDPSKPNPDLATVAELYDLAQKDFEFAAEFSPTMTPNPVRANKATANALLAFLYMNKGDFQNMYKYARIAWDMQLANYGGDVNKLLYNYNDLKYETRDPLPEVEAGVDVETELKLESPDKIADKSYNRENMLYRIGMGGSYVLPTEEYLNLFKTGDRRNKLFMLKATSFRKTYAGAGPGGSDIKIDDGIKVIDYRKSKFIDGFNLGLTHPELLLMLAESAARTGKQSEAMTALRLLRKYRYTPETADINDLTGDELIQEILNERLRELSIYTPHRFWDLKRFARESGKPWAKTTVTRVVLGETLSVDINSEKFQLEIGNTYRANNPEWGLAPIAGSYAPYKYGDPLK